MALLFRKLIHISFLQQIICQDVQRPNIVVIVADDMGKHDLNYKGAEIQTPNLDALANSGVRWENYYVQPVCSPTRGSLMTGRYPFRLGLQHENLVGYRPNGLPLDEKIMPQYFKECGYKTSMIGKWQLGFFKEQYLPWNRGFDDFFGQLLGGQDYYSRRKCLKVRNHGNLCGFDLRTQDGPVRDYSKKYQPFLYADKAVEKFHSHNKSEPLFTYIAFQSVHSPMQAPWEYMSIYKDNRNMNRYQQTFAAMVTALDKAVGDVVRGLKESGLWDNTLIFFSNDNGREGSDNSRGGKNDFWQGGITGYGFLSGPVVPEDKRGSSISDLMHISDVLPTVLSAAKCPTEMINEIDGHNYWPLLDRSDNNIYVNHSGNPLKFKRRKEIIMQINPMLKLHAADPRDFDTTWDTRTQGVIIKGDMKVISGSHSILRRKTSDKQTVWLFNITEDNEELNDLSWSKKSTTTSLLQRMADMLPFTKTPWHPPPDPASDPDNLGGFWGPYQTDSKDDVFAPDYVTDYLSED